MQVSYDKENDVLALSTGQIQHDGASLYDHVGVAVLFGTDGGRDIVGVEVMSASYWFSKGYDKNEDAWLLGDKTDKLGMTTIDGDLVGYWQPYEYAPDEVPDPIGVEIKRVSMHVPAHIRKVLRNAYRTRHGKFETTHPS